MGCCLPLDDLKLVDLNSRFEKMQAQKLLLAIPRPYGSVLRVTPETVSRWEGTKRESEHIGETSELLLRTLIMSHQKPISSYEDLSQWGKKARASLRAVFRRTRNTWTSEKAA